MQDYALRLKPRVGYAERVHRLDRDTSGAIAFALSREARGGLIRTFRDHRIERLYLAIVEGEPPAEKGTVEAPLREAWVSGRRGVAKPGEASRDARTHWRVRERLPGAALLEVELETGRQHQIRIHLAHVGLPILGDPVYGRAAHGRPLARRPMLHAFRLAFAHPITGQRVAAESPLPEDFQKALAALRRGSGAAQETDGLRRAGSLPRSRAGSGAQRASPEDQLRTDRISRRPIGESSKCTPTWNDRPSSRAQIAVPGTSTAAVRAPSWIGASKTTATVEPRSMSSPTRSRQP